MPRERTYHVRIEPMPGVIIKKVMTGPKTVEAAKAEVERQQKVITRAGETAMPVGKVTVTEWRDDEPPPPPSPFDGMEALIVPPDDEGYAV